MKYRQNPLAIIHSGQATKPSLIRSLPKRRDRGRVEENREGTEIGGGKKKKKEKGGGAEKNTDRVENMRGRMKNESLSLPDKYDRRK